MHSKNTKIVATLGPASEDKKMISELIDRGVNVFRLNFSHGDHEEHGSRISRIKEIRQKKNAPVGILQDLGGPKIRIGDFTLGQIELKSGQTFILTTKKVEGTAEIVSLNYKNLPNEVKKGDTIFLDDGKKRLEVIKTSKNDIITKVIVGGVIKSRRGVNAPDAHLSISSLTAKDKVDVKFGIDQGVDFIAMSFVRSAKDILDLKKIIENAGSRAKVVAKIETKEALSNFDEILEVTDAVMVARGDLAIEIPPEEVPIAQKMIIAKCNKKGVSVITATQMLESMTRGPVATRAEVNDVANAIFDGTDAVMLSEETAIGINPALAVGMMSRVAKRVEESSFYEERLRLAHLETKSVTDSFSYAAINMAHEISAKSIVALSKSGYTARMVARYRPHSPLIVFTSELETYYQLSVSYACLPILVEKFTNTTSIIKEAKKVLVKKGLGKKGDDVLIIAGVPLNVSGNTNLLTVQRI